LPQDLDLCQYIKDTKVIMTKWRKITDPRRISLEKLNDYANRGHPLTDLRNEPNHQNSQID